MTTEQLIYAGFTLLLIGLSANNARRLILPDIITIPGMLAGLFLSWRFPSLHGESTGSASLIASGGGVIVGAGAMYLLRSMVVCGELRHRRGGSRLAHPQSHHGVRKKELRMTGA